MLLYFHVNGIASVDKWFRNFWVLCGFSFFAAGIFVLYVLLPPITQKVIETVWGDDLTQYGIQFYVEDLGVSRALIRDVRVAEGLQAGSVEVFYGIMRERGSKFRPGIKSVIISNCSIDPEKILAIKSSRDSDQNREPLPLPSLFAMLPQKITIRQSSVLLPSKYGSLHIPWDMVIKVNSLDQTISCQFHTSLANQKLDMDTRMQYLQNGFTGSLLANVQPQDNGKPGDLSLPKICLTGNFGIFFDGSESPLPSIFFHGKTRPISSCEFIKGTTQVRLANPIMLVDMESKKGNISGKLEFQSDRGEMFDQGNSIQFANLMCTGRIHGEETSLFQFGVDVSADAISLSSKDIQGKLYPLKADVNGQFNPVGFFSGIAAMNLGKTGLVLPTSKIDIGQITGKLPFFISLDKNKKFRTLPKGSLSMEGITSSIAPKIPLNLAASLAQTAEPSIAMEGVLTCPNLSEPKVKFHGQINTAPEPDLGLNTNLYHSARLDFAIPEFLLNSTRIHPLLPMSSDLSFEGRVSLSGLLCWDQRQGLGSQGQLEIRDTFLHNRDNTLEAKGINAKIQFDDLFAPSSLPGQKISIDSIKIGKLLFTKANMTCSLERTGSFLMENANVRWCEGLVSIEALRIPLAGNQFVRQKMELTMYCDRLQLPLLLDQMGAFHSQGTGSVSGRIPVTWKGGFFSFENGFLFSTPGTGGRILLKDTDKLLAGIPMGTPQFSQLDLAREALKEFDYDWVTLRLNSQKQNLLLEMGLNGKPAHVLPFVYKKEMGRFIRVDSSSPGSHFQGIKLDVNLELPFHQAIKFGNTLLQKP